MLMWSVLYVSRNQLLLICSPLFCICAPVGGQRTEYQVRIHGCTHSGRSNTSSHRSESRSRWQYCNASIILRSRYFPASSRAVCLCVFLFLVRLSLSFDQEITDVLKNHLSGSQSSQCDESLGSRLPPSKETRTHTCTPHQFYVPLLSASGEETVCSQPVVYS